MQVSVPPSRDSPRSLPVLALAAVLYLLLSLLYLRPTAERLTHSIAPDAGDPVFNLVALSWGSHQIRSGLPDPWNLPILFPARGVTLYSDDLPGPSLLTAGLEAAGATPVIAFNLLFVSSFALCGLGTFEVLRRNGISAAVAFLGGAMFAFSPFRWDQLSHLQILLAGFVPLVLWCFDRLLEAPTWRRAVLFLVVYTLHESGGSYLAYMIHVPLAALLANRLGDLRRAPDRTARLKILVPTGLAAGFVLTAVFFPYITASRSGLRRFAGEIYHYGASLAAFFTPSARNLYDGAWTQGWRRPENVLFAGILPTALLLATIAAGVRRHGRAPERPFSPLRKTALAVFLLAAVVGGFAGEARIWTGRNPLAGLGIGGPRSYHHTAWLLSGAFWALLLWRLWGRRWPFHLAELPRFRRGLVFAGLACFLLCLPYVYEPLMHMLPGLSGMRVSGRFAALLSFVVAFFAADALDRLAVRAGRWRPAVLAGAAVFLLAELCPKPFPWIPIPSRDEQPPVYAWIARQEQVRALLEIPLEDLQSELAYMQSATLHWKPLVNGFSGYLPRDYEVLRHEGVNPAPSLAQTARLRAWGVTHVLIHRRRLREPWQRRQVNAWQQESGAEAVYRDRYGDWVYRISGRAQRERPAAGAAPDRVKRKVRRPRGPDPPAVPRGAER
jgi:hypothetical protein